MTSKPDGLKWARIDHILRQFLYLRFGVSVSFTYLLQSQIYGRRSRAMDHQRKEELKKNDLADVIEGKLVALKPHAGTIGVVALLLAAVVGGGLWMLISGQSKKEQAWTDLHAASFQARTTNSAKLLEQAASKPDTATSLPGLWARQMAADLHLNEGFQQLEFDREKGAEQVAEAMNEFKFVSENTDKVGNQLLWSRATFGLARSAEATGDFETAKAAYQAIIAEMEDSPLAKAAADKIKVLEDPVTLAWFEEFKTRKSEVRQPETGDAPESDTGLPARPDFSFPEVQAPDPSTLSSEAPPAPPEGDADEGDADEGDADKGEEAPPTPLEEENELDEKDEPAETEMKDDADDTDTDEPDTDEAKTEEATSENSEEADSEDAGDKEEAVEPAEEEMSETKDAEKSTETESRADTESPEVTVEPEVTEEPDTTEDSSETESETPAE